MCFFRAVTMQVSIAKETVLGERRVAVVPELVHKLTAAGLQVSIQSGAGREAGFSDQHYRDAGADVRTDVLGRPGILLTVRPPADDAVQQLQPDSIVIGLLEP
jgi:H+-translocating NAD(P) transhydrogenase subunit alpha